MRTVVIGIMDRDHWEARTDVIIIADPLKKTLTWVPRDLYASEISDRINAAFSIGGGKNLINSLNQIKKNIKFCVCVLPKVIQKYIDKIGSIVVQVPINMEFYYPLKRDTPIENGKRIVKFNAPQESLSGDRIHEWIGARYGIGKRTKYYDDFGRIRRQKILMRQLLDQGFNFYIDDVNPDDIRGLCGGSIFTLRNIDKTWTLRHISIKNFVDEIIDKKAVLVIKNPKNIIYEYEYDYD